MLHETDAMLETVAKDVKFQVEFNPANVTAWKLIGYENRMLRDEDLDPGSEEHNRTASSVRDIASRIPESLSAIGRDISRTIEKAISAKDDYVVAVKISPEAQEKLEALVQAGVFRSRAEAAGFLIDEGIKTQSALFDRVRQKLAEIERLRAELRGLIADNKV